MLFKIYSQKRLLFLSNFVIEYQQAIKCPSICIVYHCWIYSEHLQGKKRTYRTIRYQKKYDFKVAVRTSDGGPKIYRCIALPVYWWEERCYLQEINQFIFTFFVVEWSKQQRKLQAMNLFPEVITYSWAILQKRKTWPLTFLINRTFWWKFVFLSNAIVIVQIGTRFWRIENK